MEKSPFSKIDHVGVIVGDIDKAIEYYQALGIGPFESLNLTLTDRKLYGKPADDTKNLVMVTQMGQVQLELIQRLLESGESLPKEFLESRRNESIA